MSLVNETAKDWDNSLISQRTFPTYDQLQKFLQNRVFTVEERTADFKSTKKDNVATKSPGKKTFTASTFGKVKCIVCSDFHYLNQCAAFAAKSVSERFEIVKGNRLCLKCFNPYHSIAQCKRNNCSSCNGRHNILLHRESKTANSS